MPLDHKFCRGCGSQPVVFAFKGISAFAFDCNAQATRSQLVDSQVNTQRKINMSLFQIFILGMNFKRKKGVPLKGPSKVDKSSRLEVTTITSGFVSHTRGYKVIQKGCNSDRDNEKEYY